MNGQFAIAGTEVGKMGAVVNRQDMDARLLLLSEEDNVAVALDTMKEGESVLVGGRDIVLKSDLKMGHKLAGKNIKEGEKIMKYGVPIGTATSDIVAGDHVHVHNIRSDYTETFSLENENSEDTID